MTEDFGNIPSDKTCLYFHEVTKESESQLIFQLVNKLTSSHTNKIVQLVFIANDDKHIEQLKYGLNFFLPNMPIISFPAWDCLPYDRISPHKDIMSQRLEAMSQLRNSTQQSFILLTTVNSVLTKVPPQQDLTLTTLTLAKGQSISSGTIINFACENAYQQVDTVREPGEYAVRGGIIDIFPAGYEHPIRLDFFGDEIEQIKYFDAIKQTSITETTHIEIKAAHEILLTPQNIENFRTHYRHHFGNQAKTSDPLYESIKAGRRYPGMEHWLPFFYDSMSTIFDSLPQETRIVYNDNLFSMLKSRCELIADYYEARTHAQKTKAIANDVVYNPIAPDLLYLSEDNFIQKLDKYAQYKFSHFHNSEKNSVSFQTKKILDIKSLELDTQNIYEHFSYRCDHWQSQNKKVIITTYSKGSKLRLHKILQEYGFKNCVDIDKFSQATNPKSIYLTTLPFEEGYAVDDTVFLTEKLFFGDRLIRKTQRSKKAEDIISEASQLQSGDYLVHYEHGIGQYKDLKTLEIDKSQHDFLEIHYADNDKLFVPVENIDLLSRFGSEDTPTKLDRLGGTQWSERKARIKEKIKNLAEKLLKTAAQRKLQKTSTYNIPSQDYEKFCSLFPYPETEDQQKAIDDTLQDLTQGKLMDRLICGDVGFGKTEVALRAAFVAAMNGKQVALLVPTTLLCLQHFENFSKRFKDFPLVIRQLSRFTKPKEAKQIKEQLNTGQVDIVIGTHALLGQNIHFHDLGLLIIDEEQHFGVVQKERLKQFQSDTNILTLSATPIPRTLQMALHGVRELSLITTPPIDRLAVRSFVMPHDPVVIKEAIMREFFRGGQCFYVCPKLREIPIVHEMLKELVPDVRIAIAHGQLSTAQLEDTIHAFYNKKFDLLLSTNIVESGLDLPNANTMILHRSDLFGLSQLYQLRGRVGRSKTRAYAYFTVPTDRSLTATAQKRLEVMQTLDHLGAGFTLASHDLDIRGAGNLLGDEQSGHIQEVGSELYQRMLEDTIQALKNQSHEITMEALSPQISLGISVLIPESYIPSLNIRLSLYKRVGNLKSKEDIESFASELIDRFGELPSEVENLLRTVELKVLCRQASVAKVEVGPKGLVVQFYHELFANPAGLMSYITKNKSRMFLRPDQSLIIKNEKKSMSHLEKFIMIKNTLCEISKINNNSIDDHFVSKAAN